MTLSASNAKNMRFSLRYPPDKILGVHEGSFTATLSGSAPFAARRTNESIPHTYGTTVFVQMTYSLDGGATWQDQHVTIPSGSLPTPTFQTVEVGCYSTSSNLVMVASNFTLSNKTVTYKIVAFSKD